MSQGSCEYCTSLTSTKSPGDGTEDDPDLYVCERCLKLLRNPVTALPLIRGHLTMNLRGKIPEKVLNEMISLYMSKLASLKPNSKN